MSDLHLLCQELRGTLFRLQGQHALIACASCVLSRAANDDIWSGVESVFPLIDSRAAYTLV